MVFKGGGNVSSVGFCCLLFFWLHFGIVSLLASDFGFRFVTWPSWQVVTPGKKVTLSCTTNLRPDAIRWQHNHRFIDARNGSDLPAETKDNDDKSVRVLDDGSKGSNMVLKVSTNPYENKRQEGLYQCVASVGSIAVTSLPGRIEVAYLKPYPQKTSSVQRLEKEIGSVFSVPCGRPESLPKATLQFYKDGRLLDISDENKFHVTQTGDLLVLNAAPSSEGQYSCRAYNSFLPEFTEYSIRTNVSLKREGDADDPPLASRPPRLVSFDSVITAGIGDRVQFLCATVDSSSSFLRWSLKGSDYPLGDVVNGNAVSVVIREVTVNDEGVYRCHGNNSFGTSFVDVSLFVQEPPYTIKGPDSQSVSEESTINLECIFGGRPVPTVAWVFNGKLLTSSKTVRVLGNRLELNPVRRNQAGVYQCFAFNPFGSSQDTAVVTVIPKTVTASPYTPVTRKPNWSFEREIDLLLESETEERTKEKKKKEKKKTRDEKTNTTNNKKEAKRKHKKTEMKPEMIAPTRPNVTKLSDDSVMVTWDVESGRGIPILFFKVQYRTLEGPDHELVNRRWKTIDEDIPPHVKSFEVTGLKTNHIYRFRVLAAYVNNDNQPGLSSKKFFLEKDIKLKRPEKPPEILFLLPEDNASLTVFWNYDAKTKTEGFIIYYRESTSAAGYTKVTLLGTDRRNYTITHLRPSMSYDFKMNSFNMAGTSDFSKRETFYPKGVNLTSKRTEEKEEFSTIVPIVRSDPEGGMTNHLLYVTLGAGLGLLLLIVIASYIIYSCRNKISSGEDDTARSKFMDASLRIHRLSTGDIRQPTQNGCQCHSSTENQVPLLKKKRNIVKSNEPHSSRQNSSPQNSNVSGQTENRNGKINIMKETSFTGNDQPSCDFKESSLHSKSMR